VRGRGLSRFTSPSPTTPTASADTSATARVSASRSSTCGKKRPLGTAGALSLLTEKENAPLIVMNGGPVTKVDFGALLRFHEDEKSLATLCVREYEFQVPYGVVSMSGHRLDGIVEKPTHRFFVSAGIYVIEPAALKKLKRGAVCNMPDLLERLRGRGAARSAASRSASTGSTSGAWKSNQRAQTDYAKFF